MRQYVPTVLPRITALDVETLDRNFEDRLAKLSLTSDGKDYRELGALDEGAASQVCLSLILVQLQATLVPCDNVHCANLSTLLIADATACTSEAFRKV